MRGAREFILDGHGLQRSAGWGVFSVAVGLLIAGGLTTVDVVSGPKTIVIGTVALAPLVVAVLSGPSETALVGMVALVLATVSGL